MPDNFPAPKQYCSIIAVMRYSNRTKCKENWLYCVTRLQLTLHAIFPYSSINDRLQLVQAIHWCIH